MTYNRAEWEALLPPSITRGPFRFDRVLDDGLLVQRSSFSSELWCAYKCKQPELEIVAKVDEKESMPVDLLAKLHEVADDMYDLCKDIYLELVKDGHDQ